MTHTERQSLKTMSLAEIERWLAGRDLTPGDAAFVLRIFARRLDYLERLVTSNLDRKPVVSLPLPRPQVWPEYRPATDSLPACTQAGPEASASLAGPGVHHLLARIGHPDDEPLDDENPCDCDFSEVAGVLFSQHDAGLRVERCPACHRYPSDLEAGEAAAKSLGLGLAMGEDSRFYLIDDLKGGDDHG